MLSSHFLLELTLMMRPDAKVQKVYLYPKPVDFRKSINGLAALVELDINVEVFNPVLFVFLNRTRSQVKILYWERNGFCLWLKRLEAERFKTKPAAFCKVVGASAVFLSCYFQCRLLPLWVERDGADGLPIPRRA